MKSARVLVFGDSIGQGFYDEINGGWVSLLQKDFFKIAVDGGSTVNIINLSVSADTSKNVLSRLDSECRTRINTEKMCTILCIGVNDSAEEGGRKRTSENDFKSNIVYILDTFKKLGFEVVVLGLTPCIEAKTQPVAWDEKISYSNQDLGDYNDLLKVICDGCKVEFVELFDEFVKHDNYGSLLPDGLHPNSEGHKKIYNIVKPKLMEMLK